MNYRKQRFCKHIKTDSGTIFCLRPLIRENKYCRDFVRTTNGKTNIFKTAKVVSARQGLRYPAANGFQPSDSNHKKRFSRNLNVQVYSKGSASEAYFKKFHILAVMAYFFSFSIFYLKFIFKVNLLNFQLVVIVFIWSIAPCILELLSRVIALHFAYDEENKFHLNYF